MSDEANPSGALDIEGAAARLKSLFDAEPEPPTAKNKEATEEITDSETPDNPETLDDSGDTEDEVLYEVKYGDTVEKLTLDQLIKGNMMERNYRQGTMENADIRRALNEKTDQFDSYLADLEKLVNIEADDLASPEMQELREIDPDSYWKAFEKTKIKVDKLKQLQEAQSKEKSEKEKEALAKESALILDAIPEWNNNDKAQEEWKELAVYLGGFDIDISTKTNHKDILLARKAMLFDKIQSEKIEDKKVNTPPMSTKPNATQDKPKAKDNKARDRLKKTGHVRDAQAAFKELLFK